MIKTTEVDMEPVIRDSVYTDFDLLNAVIIGMLVGVYQVVGRGGTQAVINMAGEYIGREILQFAKDHNEPIENLEQFRAFLIRYKLAGDIRFIDEQSGIRVIVEKCRTCPKKVGHYSFDGSACPWGGIMIGAFTTILQQNFSYAARLVPGEVCEISIARRK
jgi:predicted hydrocarbon binding protein